MGMGTQHHISAAVGKNLRPVALSLVRFRRILSAPMDEYQHKVRRLCRSCQVPAHQVLILQSMEHIGRLLRQSVAIGHLSITEHGTGDALPLQQLVGLIAAILHRLDTGIEYPGLPIEICRQIDGIGPLVQGMVAGAAHDIEAGTDYRLAHLYRCAEGRIIAVVLALVHIDGLLMKAGHIISGQFLRHPGKQVVKIAVQLSQTIVIDGTVDQIFTQSSHGKLCCFRPLRQGAESPGDPVPGTYPTGSLLQGQTVFRRKGPALHLHPKVRGHPDGFGGLPGPVVDEDVLGPDLLLRLLLPEGAALPIAALPPAQEHQFPPSVVVDITPKHILNRLVRFRLPDLFISAPQSYPPVLQGNTLRLAPGRFSGQISCMPDHPLRRVVFLYGPP